MAFIKAFGLQWSRSSARPQPFFTVFYDGESLDKDRIHCRIHFGPERERERQGLFWRENRPAKIEVVIAPSRASPYHSLNNQRMKLHDYEKSEKRLFQVRILQFSLEPRAWSCPGILGTATDLLLRRDLWATPLTYPSRQRARLNTVPN